MAYLLQPKNSFFLSYTEFSKPKKPPYLSYFINHKHVEREKSCLAPLSLSRPRMFPRAVSEKHGDFLSYPLKPEVASGIEKFMPWGLHFVCFIFNYLILSDSKNALAKSSGADIISFLKTWVSLPAPFGLFYLSKTLPFFYPMIVPVIAFSGPVEVIFYQLINYYNPQPSAAFLFGLKIPKMSKISVLSNVGPGWWSLLTSLLSWGYVNLIAKAEETKRFHPLFGISVNVSLIFFGRTVKNFSILEKNFGSGADGCGVILWGMMSLVALMAPVIWSRWVNADVPPPTPGKKKVTTKKRALAARTNRKKNEGPKNSPRKKKSRNQMNDVSEPQQRNRIHIRITEIRLDN